MAGAECALADPVRLVQALVAGSYTSRKFEYPLYPLQAVVTYSLLSMTPVAPQALRCGIPSRDVQLFDGGSYLRSTLVGKGPFQPPATYSWLLITPAPSP